GTARPPLVLVCKANGVLEKFDGAVPVDGCLRENGAERLHPEGFLARVARVEVAEHGPGKAAGPGLADRVKCRPTRGQRLVAILGSGIVGGPDGRPIEHLRDGTAQLAS